MPSQLNASPKGEPLHVAAVFGNGANWLATPASESSVKFTLSVNAHPRAVACAWMIALYRSCSTAKNLVSAGAVTPGGGGGGAPPGPPPPPPPPPPPTPPAPEASPGGAPPRLG